MATNRTLYPTVTHAFLNRVKTQGDRPVMNTKQGADYVTITWNEYYENVKQLSYGLRSLGVKPGDKVCILSNTCLEWMACDMAIMGAHAITVPIYASNTATDSAYIFNHCEARILLIEDSKQLEKMLDVKASMPNLEKIVVFQPIATRELAAEKDVLSLSALRELGKRSKKNDFDELLASTSPEDTFTICYTSGTTGVPKGVVLTHDSLTSVIEDIERVIGKHVSENDIVLTWLPYSHIFGKIESMATYHFGWRMYFAESIDKLFTNIGEVRPTLLFAVPRIFEKAYNKIIVGAQEGGQVKKLLFSWVLQVGRDYYEHIWNHRRPPLKETIQFELARRLVLSKVYAKFGGRMRYCIAGGAPLPLEVAQFMQIVGITILEGYGLTETCAPVTLNTPDGHRFGSIGKPLPEVAIKLGSDGEILIKSRKVFSEYYKNKEATAEVMSDGWFHTGDIGTIDAEGFVKITDRKKDLIITSGGKNVAPQKIENLLKTQRYMNQIMIVGDKRNYLAAVLTLDREDIIKYAKENNILFSEYAELVKQDKIRALVQKAIDQVNEQLPSFESIKKYHILPFDLTIEGGEITPSLKLKRKFCNEKYKSVIEEIYGTSDVS